MTAESIVKKHERQDELELSAARQSQFSAEVADFCSLLSVASRVLIATLNCGRGPAVSLGSTLTSLSFAVETLHASLDVTIDRCDTVVVLAGPGINDNHIRFVQAVVDSEAVLLTITAPRPPAPFDRADATVSIQESGPDRFDQDPTSMDRSTFDHTALAVVHLVRPHLSQLLRNRPQRCREG